MAKKNRDKSWGVIGWAIFILALLSAYMIYVYFDTFHDGYSDDFNKWGAFGGYFGSITGLFAFLGVLYTVKQSNEQVKANEERGIFFTMMGLYQKQVDSMTDGKTKGINAFTNYIDEINKITTMYIIYYEIVSNENYEFSTEDGSIEEIIQNELIYTFNFDENLTGILQLKAKIQSYLGVDKLIIPDKFNNNRTLYEIYAINILNKNINDTLDKEVLKKYIFILLNRSAKVLNVKYGQYLGQYFRNIFYLLETISTTKDWKHFSEIFKAQLSSSELTLLLFNALSSQSSKETVDYYSKYEIFDNIDIENNIILKSFYLRFVPKDFINELFEIYKTNN